MESFGVGVTVVDESSTKDMTPSLCEHGICIKDGDFSWDKVDRVELKQKLTSKRSRSKLKHERIRSSSVSTECILAYSLQGINVHIKPKEFVAVIGSVGSGKSSLLSVILHELPSMDPENTSFISFEGQEEEDEDMVIGYASQKPWYVCIAPSFCRMALVFLQDHE